MRCFGVSSSSFHTYGLWRGESWQACFCLWMMGLRCGYPNTTCAWARASWWAWSSPEDDSASVPSAHAAYGDSSPHLREKTTEFIIWNMVLHYQIPRLPGRSCHLFLVLICHQNVITFSTSKKPGRHQSSLVIFQFLIDKSHITFSLLNILFHFEKHHILKVKSVQAGFKTSMGFFFKCNFHWWARNSNERSSNYEKKRVKWDWDSDTSIYI